MVQQRIDFWGLKKPVLYLQACLWTGLGCNDRLLDCCADVDTATIYEGEADPFDLPVMDHKRRKVTPPDLRKERQVYLFEELLKPKYAVDGFKTADLQRTLSDHFANSAQIRYEMKKLTVRGAIQNKKTNHSTGLQKPAGNGYGLQFAPRTILKTL